MWLIILTDRRKTDGKMWGQFSWVISGPPGPFFLSVMLAINQGAGFGGSLSNLPVVGAGRWRFRFDAETLLKFVLELNFDLSEDVLDI